MAWSRGDVDRIRILPESSAQVCTDLLSQEADAGRPLTQIRTHWLEALESQLGDGGTALAVVDLDLLLMHGGLLESLRAAGLQIDGP